MFEEVERKKMDKLSGANSAALVYKADQEFQLFLKDEGLGDIVILNEDEIDKLLEVLSYRKKIRDREEGR